MLHYEGSPQYSEKKNLGMYDKEEPKARYIGGRNMMRLSWLTKRLCV